MVNVNDTDGDGVVTSWSNLDAPRDACNYQRSPRTMTGLRRCLAVVELGRGHHNRRW